MTPLLLFAAHQGEEFVIILPVILLAGAFFIVRWANKPTTDEEADRRAANEEAASDEELIEAARKAVNGKSLAAVGQVAVEPQDEAHAGDDPDHHDRQGGGVAQRLTK